MENADHVWHAGDIGNIKVVDQLLDWNPSLKAVYGNIDGHQIRSEYPEYLLERFGKHTILMIHIAGAVGKYNQKTRSLITHYSPTILICGHSHILKVKRDANFNLLHINPGACGHHGFHQIRTLIRFTLHTDKLTDLNVIELGKRGRIP